MLPEGAVLIPRSEHTISRVLISKNALKVLYRLKNTGYGAFLVGGGVRDLLLGREPKDFDVATNARPEQIRKNFRNGRLIGRRFRLVHVLFKNEIIEVSTFRAEHTHEITEESQTEEGMLLHDNVYGSFAEDAARRDFTINALYYNIADFSLIDCHQGLVDLKQGILRIIGNPEQRYREDPVRILRAIRFSVKLGFRIHEDSEKPIFTMGYLLSNVPPARLFTEMEKLFLGGIALPAFKLLRHYHLLKFLFPAIEDYLAQEDYENASCFLSNGLADTDLRITQGKPVTPSFLCAVLLWYPLQNKIKQLLKEETPPQIALQIASTHILTEETETIALPRRFSVATREIWLLQESFRQRKQNKVFRTLGHPRFRAGFDFLLLRARSDEELQELAEWWSKFYEADETIRKQMSAELGKDKRRKRRKKFNTKTTI